MSILVDLYDTRSLSQAINKLNTTEPFVLKTIFGYKEQHDADKVDIEITEGSSKLAQFVSANETNPLPAAKTTKSVKTVTIPRTYESKIFTAQDLKNISVAGGIYANAAERRAAQEQKVIMELADLKDRVIRLREYMACKAISTGKVEISQDNIEFKVDFGFTTNNTTGQIRTLSGADLWDATTSDPMSFIRSWQKFIMKKSYQQATVCLLGADAAAAFTSNANVIKQLDASNYRMGQLDLNQKLTLAAQYIGTIAGIDFYEYVQQYVTPAGVATPMIADDKAILIAAGNTNRLHYGPAYRINGNSVNVFNGEFLLEVDPHSNNQKLQWNCEQKSLPAVHDPGVVVSATVV